MVLRLFKIKEIKRNVKESVSKMHYMASKANNKSDIYPKYNVAETSSIQQNGSYSELEETKHF